MTWDFRSQPSFEDDAKINLVVRWISTEGLTSTGFYEGSGIHYHTCWNEPRFYSWLWFTQINITKSSRSLFRVSFIFIFMQISCILARDPLPAMVKIFLILSFTFLPALLPRFLCRVFTAGSPDVSFDLNLLEDGSARTTGSVMLVPSPRLMRWQSPFHIN